MEPPSRLELETPSLPWKCSTTELRRHWVYFTTDKRKLQVGPKEDLLDFGPTPFDGGKAFAVYFLQLLLVDFSFLIERLIFHHDPNERVGFRAN